MKVEDHLWSSCYGEVWNFDHLCFTLLLWNNLSLSMRKGETSREKLSFHTRSYWNGTFFLIQFRRAVSLSGYFKNKPYISSLTYWAGVLVCAIKHMVVLLMAGFLTSVSQFYVIFLENWLTDIISWFSHFSHTAPEGTYPRKIRDAFRQLVSTSFFQKKGFHFFHAKPMRLFDV